MIVVISKTTNQYIHIVYSLKNCHTVKLIQAQAVPKINQQIITNWKHPEKYQI